MDKLTVTMQFLDLLESSENLPALPNVIRRIGELLQRRSLDMKDDSDENLQMDEQDEQVDGNSRRIEDFTTAIRTMEVLTSPIYVDVLYLCSNIGYVIKEFSAQCIGSPFTANIIVKSPPDAIPCTEENGYASKYLHGIAWRDGVIELQQLKTITADLFKKGRPVYVKGFNKVKILNKTLGVDHSDIRELTELPALQNLRRDFTRNSCEYHSNMSERLACARKHTNAMLACNEEEKWDSM